MPDKTIFWDFDGTLGFRKDGMWGRSMIEALEEHDPNHKLVEQNFRPFLSTGFPWHEADVPHTHVTSPEQWWSRILQKFQERIRKNY